MNEQEEDHVFKRATVSSVILKGEYTRSEENGNYRGISRYIQKEADFAFKSPLTKILSWYIQRVLVSRPSLPAI